MATITINGDLTLDQTTGVQAGTDDADLVVQAVNPGIDDLANNSVNTDGGRQIDQAFLNYINGLTSGLSDSSMDFAAKVEGASHDGLISVSVGANETVNRLFFSDANGNDLNGVHVTGVQTINGSDIYLYTAAGTNGKVVLATDNATAGQGNIVAAFYLDTDGANSITSAGVQTITFVALKHPNPNDPNDQVDFTDVLKISAVVTTSVGDHIGVIDDAPTIVTSGVTEPILTADESDLTTNPHSNFAANFTPDYGTDGQGATGGIVYALGAVAGASGLTDTLTGQAVNLSKNLVTGDIEGKTATSGVIVFTVHADAASGEVTLDQQRAVVHADTTTPDDSRSLTADNLVTLTATITDADGDHQSATLNIGQNLVFKDDGPTITVASSASTTATAAHLGNAVGQHVTGDFGYNIGADGIQYTGGHSDVVQMSLSGSVSGPPSAAITNPTVTLDHEDASSATFNFSFGFDGDPTTAGIQAATAGGTLVLDKVNHQFTVNLNDAVDGFSNSIFHTANALDRNPNTNSGHPNVVIEKLSGDNPNTAADEDFYVQFTANAKTNPAPFRFTDDGQGTSTDTVFGGANDPHDLVSNTNETWVSATQGTNGVAGDTIQQNEVLTLRFFNQDILADGGTQFERLGPDTARATADGLAIKFDGVGASEDLIVVLDLKDSVTGLSITRAITVDNADIFKTGHVPSAYASQFTLDNNDGLLVLESNDYNKPGEHYEIQGVQIMQSANGLTGSAINLNGAVGDAGGSLSANGTTFAANGTDFIAQSFTDPSFGSETDVLKITDIGFIQTTRGTQSADLDFSFKITDGDGDLTALQHIDVNINNGWIV